MRIGAALLASAALLSGCAAGRNWNFARQYLSGDAPLEDCAAGPQGPAVCRFAPKGPADEESVLFFLHYATGDERSLARIGLIRSFHRRYRKLGRLPPKVVSVSYGTHWILSREPGKRQVIGLEPFLKTLASLEPQAKRRYLWGMSMGGYNAAVAALATPGAWNAAALSCPALHASSPFADSSTPALLALPGARRGNVEDGRALVTTRLAGPETWERENPLALARRETLPAFLIQANARDEFGFAPGARALAEALREAGGRVEHRELPGGHCVIDGGQVADFLLGLSPG